MADQPSSTETTPAAGAVPSAAAAAAAPAPQPAAAEPTAAAETKAAAAAEPSKSMFAAADPAKHGELPTADAAKADAPKADVAPAKTDATAEAPKADAADTTKTDGKTDAKAEATADGEKKSEPAGETKPAAEAGEKKPEGDKQPEKTAEALAQEPPAPPKYDAYKLPDNFKADNARLEKFNGILGKTELAAKADHTLMQTMGQELVDFHVEEMQRVANDMRQYQIDSWNRHKEALINRTKADPQIGGNRIETAMANARYAFENYVGLKPEQKQDLLAALDNSGISNHPEFIRAFNNLYERMGMPKPAQPNLPGKDDGKGQRNWYGTVDGASAA